MDICFFNVFVLLYLIMGFFCCILFEIIYIKFIFIFEKKMFIVLVYIFMIKMYFCFDVSLGIFMLYDRIIKIRKSMFKICKINNDILVYWGFNIKEVCCIVV